MHGRLVRRCPIIIITNTRAKCYLSIVSFNHLVFCEEYQRKIIGRNYLMSEIRSFNCTSYNYENASTHKKRAFP